MKKLIILLAVLSLPSYAAEIKKWTDASGKIHYGDAPPTGVKAEEVNVSKSISTESGAVNTASDFYGVPQYPERINVEKKDSPDTPATMRFLTSSSVIAVSNFYKNNIKEQSKLENVDGTIYITYKSNDLNRMITIQDYFGRADVTILAEK